MQGGTFYNDAVLRALEKLLGCTVVRPDVAGLMGAYGIALITRDRCPTGHATTLIAPDGLASLSFQKRRNAAPAVATTAWSRSSASMMAGHLSRATAAKEAPLSCSPERQRPIPPCPIYTAGNMTKFSTGRACPPRKPQEEPWVSPGR